MHVKYENLNTGCFKIIILFYFDILESKDFTEESHLVTS